jgi:hypothetical protein
MSLGVPAYSGVSILYTVCYFLHPIQYVLVIYVVVTQRKGINWNKITLSLQSSYLGSTFPLP